MRRGGAMGALVFCLGLTGCVAQAYPGGGLDGAFKGDDGLLTRVSAEKTVMVPHVAEYNFKISRSEPGSSVVDASGVMGYRFERVCDGWITEMQQVLILQGAEGSAINSAFSMIQWENFDGTRYRFRMRDYLDGTRVDEIVGEATRGDDGVTVAYQQPAEVVEELPAETLFPTQHAFMLLEKARQGVRFANDLVFDGSGDTPTNRVAVVISDVRPADNAANDADGIAATPYHRMSLAYYPLGAAENGPSSEMTVDYGQNGVAHALSLNYGDFSVAGTLDNVMKLAQPDCGDRNN